MDDDKRRSWRAGIEQLRLATPDERLQAASEQRRISLDLLKGGLRSRFPGLSEDGIESKAGEIVFGRTVWREICERRQRCFGRH